MPEVEKHKRVHDMLLGPLERPTLRWLASKQPGWVNPDTLTVIGIIGSLIIFFSYLLTNRDPVFLWFASLGFVINWYGDSLDGTLARHRKIERPKYGFFVDHTVDSFSMAVIFIGLGLSAFVRLDLAALACIGYLLMSILSYVGAFVSGNFKISYARIGPTEMRLIAIIANILIFIYGNPEVTIGGFAITVFDLIIAIIAAALYLVFIVSTASEALAWRKVDLYPTNQLEEDK
jgi:archaetidylinositol phosphate synthase